MHHPDMADGRDDAPDATALMCFAGKTGQIGEMLFLKPFSGGQMDCRIRFP